MKQSTLVIALTTLILAIAPISIQAQKKEKAPPKTALEIYEELGKMKPTGDSNLDAFVKSSVDLLSSFKTMSDNWQNINIEVTEVEDTGDGVTTAVSITDAEGNPRTKEKVTEDNLNTVLNATSMVLNATNLGLSGTNLIMGIVADPIRALSLAFGIKKVKLCIEAIGALGREVPVFIENVKTQNALIAQSKQI